MNTFSRFQLIPWILAVNLLGIPHGATAADSGIGDAGDWKFGAEGYLWLPWIDITTETGSDIEISLDDILNNLDMLFMGVLSAGKGRWSLVTDIIYFDIESNENTEVLPLLELKNLDLSAWIVTPQVRYSVLQTDKYRLGLVAGARYLQIEAQVKLDTKPPLPAGSRDGSDSGSVWDGIVGLTGQRELTDKWYLSGYLDVGSGESDHTWQVSGSVNYRFRKVDAVAGYRHLDYDIGSDKAISKLSVSGPFLGLRYRF
jgi:hypothetical protein